MFTKRKLFYLLGTVLIVSLVGCAAPSDNGDTGDTTPDKEPAQESFGASVDYNVVGIEPGAGIMINTDKAMEAYNLEEAGWNLQFGNLMRYFQSRIFES
jgi:glycine betaine/proline transport system substrate-binding protein